MWSSSFTHDVAYYKPYKSPVCLTNCEQSKLFGVFSGTNFLYTVPKGYYYLWVQILADFERVDHVLVLAFLKLFLFI